MSKYFLGCEKKKELQYESHKPLLDSLYEDYAEVSQGQADVCHAITLLHSQYNTLNELIENNGKLKSANENDASVSTTFETRNQS